MSDHHSTSIAIIGGGLAGKMMALALSYSGFQTSLIAPDISRKTSSHASASGDKRSTTIHQAGAKMLTALGLDKWLADEMVPITKIAVALGQQPQNKAKRESDWLLHWTSMVQDNQLVPMAYVIENSKLDHALDSALAALPDAQKITMIDDAIVRYDDQANGACLTGQSGKVITADLVVACDGHASAMRTLAGLKPKITETGQSAFIADVACEIPHDNTAYQRFLPTGPFAFMPLAGRQLSMVWSTSTTQADALLLADDEAINAALCTAFGDELGKLTLLNRPSCYPLRPQFNRHLTKGPVILAGDAAHSIHPLAGMGYNLALADAAILLDILHDISHKGLTANHMSVMRAYQRRRLPEVTALSQATAQLNRLLSRPANLMTQLMSLGMSVLDKTPLKGKIRDIAMGGKLAKASLLDGHLPSA